MKVALIGPELEENLGLRYLHSAIEQSGHTATIFNFYDKYQTQMLVSDILEYAPQVIGLSLVFTGRANEFLQLANQLRAAGFAGHIIAGGHFASFHAREILTNFSAVNAIVHGEGENTIIDLIENLNELHSVPGITYRDTKGNIENTGIRPNPDNLDSLAFPTRPNSFHKYFGLSIANMLGSRGCYGRCHYCSITAWYKQNSGRLFRQRSVQNIALEMSELYHKRGVRIFNFHDDNFFFPNKTDSINRFTALQDCLKEECLGRIAFQVKARPDSVHKDTISPLKEMGLFRVFLGVENNSSDALKALGRGIPRDMNHTALKILQDFNIHVTFNLLMFEPETTMADIRENINFMRQYSHLPLNFGRTEVYSGTPLEKILRSQNRLLGNYMGYSYVISNEESQKAFELYRRIFMPRNFDDNGMNLQAMNIDYQYYLLKHFFPEHAKESLRTKVKRLISRLNNNSADMLTDICNFVESKKRNNPTAFEAFADKLSQQQRTIDTKLSLQSQTLLYEMRELSLSSKKSLRSTSTVAASAAAAVIMITVAGCKKRYSTEMMPLPTDQNSTEVITHQSQILHLSSDEIQTILDRIQAQYMTFLNQSLAKYNLIVNKFESPDPNTPRSDSQWTLDLQIDSTGKVISSKIALPKDFEIESIKKDFAEQINNWDFPTIKKDGTSKLELIMQVGEFPPWHFAEMMMRPIQPEPNPNQ
jgi:anaerobic magnesium-protoporphyrin IX monomethyl ester cyclase